MVGDYKLTITEPATNVGNFIVEDPNGKYVGQGDVASAFSAGGLAFTLADGSTDFAAGDGFDITVSALVEKEVEYNPAGTDGSQIATGILYGAVNATSADTRGVAYKRDCEHNADIVKWKTGATTAQKAKGTADLKRRGIILR
jgi:hypothetical protein